MKICYNEILPQKLSIEEKERERERERKYTLYSKNSDILERTHVEESP